LVSRVYCCYFPRQDEFILWTWNRLSLSEDDSRVLWVLLAKSAEEEAHRGSAGSKGRAAEEEQNPVELRVMSDKKLKDWSGSVLTTEAFALVVGKRM
jgi:hypothetical protein